MTTSNPHSPMRQEPQSAKGGWRIWYWLVEPAASIQELGARRQARLFSSILVVLVPLVLNGVIQTARFDNPMFGALLGLLPVVVLAYGLSRTKYYQLGITLTLTALSAVVFASFLLGDDYSSPIFLLESLIWMAQAILLGSILLSLRGTIILIAANLVGLALLPVFIPEVPISNLSTLVGFMLNMSVLTVVAYRHRDSLEKDRQFELTERNRELQAARAALEQNVADLTRASRVLETSEALGRRLATILDQPQLIAAVVEQVGSAFNYSHVHLYLLDETGEYLVEAGGAAAAQEYKIPCSQGLAGRAAQTKQVALASDVTQEAAWLPHPFSPEAKAEVAAPIIFGGQVLGVLDVQHNVSGGLQLQDAELIQAIANQVAVALRNTHLFAEAEAALAEARIAQERYIERAWEKGKAGKSDLKHRYTNMNAPALSEAILTRTKAHALGQKRPVMVSLDGSETAPKSIVAPVIVGGKTVGALQLHNTESANMQPWHEEDLALVEAVLDQVAQTAENLRLFDETRQRAEYERTVGEITQKIRQAPNLESLAKMAAETLVEVLGTSGGEIRLNITGTTLGGNGHGQ
ncbi:MAG: GAF domain-containing protein [Anaerolineae bacterium]